MMSENVVEAGRVRDVVSLITALVNLWNHFLPLLNPANWNDIKALLAQVVEDLNKIWEEFGGEENAFAMLSAATDADFDAAAEAVQDTKVCFAGPEGVVRKFDGTLIKLLIKYGPTIYNMFAAFFGWPIIPVPPIPVDDDTLPVG